MSARERIVEAMRAIADDKEGVTQIIKVGQEYYFSYKGRNWSITRVDPDEDRDYTYFFYFYPGDGKSIEAICEMFSGGFVEPGEYLAFRELDYPTKDRSAFRDLYSVLDAKYFGLDSVLDEILGKEPEIPF